MQAALNAIPGTHGMSVNDFTGVQDIQTLAMDSISADESCSGYADMFTVKAEQDGEIVEDGTGSSYTVKVTVTFKADDGTTITRSKNVELRVEKNPVTITASVLYPEDSRYIAYGTSLKEVALTDCTATSGGTAVEGNFDWADGAIVPLAADNGMEIYKVVFTPEDTEHYSTAELLLAVNTQIGVQIDIDVPAAIEYTGQPLDASDCVFRAIDMDTGSRIDGVTLSLEGAVLTQSQLTPGTATLTLTGFETCQVDGVTDAELYAIVGRGASASIAITRAATKLSGDMAYAADYGQLLSSVSLNLKATTSGGTAVSGRIDWEQPATRLGEVGEFTYTVTFTPSDLNC